jgi:YbbR domain-containing protein
MAPDIDPSREADRGGQGTSSTKRSVDRDSEEPTKRWVRLVSSALSANWSSKVLALVLAFVVFAMTRDQVVRRFPVRIDLREDPDRILVSDVPREFEVEVRGAWGRIQQLRPIDFPPLVVDLRDANPGPLIIEGQALTLPSGVALVTHELELGVIPLEFVPAQIRSIPIEAKLDGEIDPHFEIAGVQVMPAKWRVRGAANLVEKLEKIPTMPISVNGARESFDTEIEVSNLPVDVRFLDRSTDARPRVRVRVNLRERKIEEMATVDIADAISRQIPSADLSDLVLPRVKIRGPLAVLETIDLAHALEPERVSAVPEVGESSANVAIRLKWVDAIDERARGLLHFEPETLNVIVQLKPTLGPSAPNLDSAVDSGARAGKR